MEEQFGRIYISEEACRLKGKSFFDGIFDRYDMLLDYLDSGELYEGLFVTGDKLGDIYLSCNPDEASFIDEQDISDEEFSWVFSEDGKEE